MRRDVHENTNRDRDLQQYARVRAGEGESGWIGKVVGVGVCLEVVKCLWKIFCNRVSYFNKAVVVGA